MFSTVWFSVSLAPTASHAVPLSLRTSICGSMNTTAVSFLWTLMAFVSAAVAAAVPSKSDAATIPVPPISRSRRDGGTSSSFVICRSPQQFEDGAHIAIHDQSLQEIEAFICKSFLGLLRDFYEASLHELDCPRHGIRVDSDTGKEAGVAPSVYPGGRAA